VHPGRRRQAIRAARAVARAKLLTVEVLHEDEANAAQVLGKPRRVEAGAPPRASRLAREEGESNASGHVPAPTAARVYQANRGAHGPLQPLTDVGTTRPATVACGFLAALAQRLLAGRRG